MNVKPIPLASASLFFALFLLPLASASVRVDLKNGTSIVADACRQEGDRLLCSKMGGFFELDSGEIEKMTELSAVPESDRETTGEGEKSGDGEVLKKEQSKPSAGGTGDQKTGPEKRLTEIRKRKLELSREREELMKEREALQQDARKAPDWMPEKKFEDLKKRSADFDAKLKAFNDEVTALNKEEKELSGEAAKPAEAQSVPQ